MKHLALIATAAIQLAVASAQLPPGLPASTGAKNTADAKRSEAQAKANQQASEAQRKERAIRQANDRALVSKAEREGISVRLDAIAHFRGAVPQHLVGVGLVTGLAGTGDSQSYTATQIAAASMLNQLGMKVDVANFQAKNIALVTVTCELPPFSAAGQTVDVTVSAFGDAKSLQNGTLLYAPLKYVGRPETYAVAQGAISVGGFSAQSKGNSSSRGFVTVGKVPGGATIQEAVTSTTVWDGKMYLDLDKQDAMTAQRVEEKIIQTYPELRAHTDNGSTVELTLPVGISPNSVQSKILELMVQANTEAKIVVEERSGTIIIGGNVRIAPCAIAQGSISVQVAEDWSVSQPAPASGGLTASVTNSTVQATEETAQIAVLRPNTTVADLAQIFQALHLHANDIIAILENMAAQGALKAKLVIQ